jgi:hypothetical protein
MTQQELVDLVARSMRDAGGVCQPRRLLPGEEDYLNGADGRSQWMIVLDDCTPGTDGPVTFDGPALARILRSAMMVVIDHAPERDADVYDFLARTVPIGNRVFVIQTNNDRREIWHEFLSARWRNGDIAEVVPVENCLGVSGRLRFNQPVRGSRKSYGDWNTPWGPANRLTRIAAGIECFETATSSCYRLTPARNGKVPQSWRDVASSRAAVKGWYVGDDAAIVILAFPNYFGVHEVVAAREVFSKIFEPKITARASQ